MSEDFERWEKGIKEHGYGPPSMKVLLEELEEAENQMERALNGLSEFRARAEKEYAEKGWVYYVPLVGEVWQFQVRFVRGFHAYMRAFKHLDQQYGPDDPSNSYDFSNPDEAALYKSRYEEDYKP